MSLPAGRQVMNACVRFGFLKRELGHAVETKLKRFPANNLLIKVNVGMIHHAFIFRFVRTGQRVNSRLPASRL